MKRELKHHREVAVKSPKTPKTQQKELERFLATMVELMGERFRNQVLNELHMSTVDKFADAQKGNYAKVFLGLAGKLRRKMAKQFDDDRIEKIVRQNLSKVNAHNKRQLYAMVEKRIGVSAAELHADEGLSYQINALVAETAQWAKKLRDETLEQYTANSLKAMTHGKSLEDIMKQFDGLVAKRKDHARFTARNQINNFHSVATKLRAQNLGIDRARWITSRDDRVRPSHVDRDGKEFDLTKGLWSNVDRKHLIPGVDYQCRCTYDLIIPEG